MKTQSTTLMSGREGDWCWNLSCIVLRNGTFEAKGKWMFINPKEYYQSHLDELRKYKNQWNKLHPEITRKNKMIFHLRHREEERKYAALRYEKYPEKCKAISKKYFNTVKGKKSRKKANDKMRSKRRGLGFIPINESFSDSEAHHIDKEFVLYIPKEIHQSVFHNIWTGLRIKEINDKAFEWLAHSENFVLEEKKDDKKCISISKINYNILSQTTLGDLK